MNSQFLVTKSRKSIGLAIFLAFLFGPIGLFYASVTGGLIMTFTPVLLVFLMVIGVLQESALLMLGSLGLFTIIAPSYWLTNIIWAAASAHNYNRQIEEDARNEYAIWTGRNAAPPTPLIVNITDRSSPGLPSVTSKPSLQEWLSTNPAKTINDYYAKFGK